jgi:hypothetical protein
MFTRKSANTIVDDESKLKLSIFSTPEMEMKQIELNIGDDTVRVFASIDVDKKPVEVTVSLFALGSYLSRNNHRSTIDEQALVGKLWDGLPMLLSSCLTSNEVLLRFDIPPHGVRPFSAKMGTTIKIPSPSVVVLVT